MDDIDKRLLDLEKNIERLLLIQEQNIKAQEVTTKNVDSLRADIKSLIYKNSDLMLLQSSCKSAHKRIDTIESVIGKINMMIIGFVIMGVLGATISFIIPKTS